MALKLIEDSLDAVDKAAQPLYVEKDGKFHLDVEGLPDVSGYESALEKERRTSRALQKQLKAFEREGALVDPTKLAEELAELEELRGQKDAMGKSRDEQVQQVADKLRKEFAQQLEARDKNQAETEAARKAAEQKLRTYRIESTLEQSAVRKRVRKEYLEDVKLRAPLFTVLDGDDAPEGEAVVMLGGDGNPIISTQQGRKYVGPDDWLDQMSKEKPGWFEPNTGGGAAGGSSGNSSARGVVSRDDGAGILANLENLANQKTALQ